MRTQSLRNKRLKYKMPKTNEELKDAALEAVRNYHSDDSVSLSETLQGLQEIAQEANNLAAAVTDDIGRDGEDAGGD